MSLSLLQCICGLSVRQKCYSGGGTTILRHDGSYEWPTGKNNICPLCPRIDNSKLIILKNRLKYELAKLSR